MKHCHYCHAQNKIQVFRYDDHIMRRYRCTGCGNIFVTREEIVAEVEYTRFHRESMRLPVRVYRTENLCHGLQDLDPRSFRRMAEAVLQERLIIRILGGDSEMHEMQCADAQHQDLAPQGQGTGTGDTQDILLRDLRSALQKQRDNNRPPASQGLTMPETDLN